MLKGVGNVGVNKKKMNQGVLARSKVYPGTDGHNYLCIQLTDVVPDSKNTQDLYKLIDYIPTLKQQFVIIIDTRDAQALYYFQYFPEFLGRLSNAPGECVERCEVWVTRALGPMLSMIHAMIHKALRTNGNKIEIKFYDE